MNRIKELRKKNGVRQSDLAKYLNIAQNTLSYWEQGKYDIDNISLQKLAVYFNTTTDYILGVTNNSTAPSEKESLASIDEALQIVAKGRDLTKKDIEYLKHTIKMLEAKNKIDDFNNEFGEEKIVNFNLIPKFNYQDKD